MFPKAFSTKDLHCT